MEPSSLRINSTEPRHRSTASFHSGLSACLPSSSVFCLALRAKCYRKSGGRVTSTSSGNRFGWASLTILMTTRSSYRQSQPPHNRQIYPSPTNLSEQRTLLTTKGLYILHRSPQRAQRTMPEARTAVTGQNIRVIVNLLSDSSDRCALRLTVPSGHRLIGCDLRWTRLVRASKQAVTSPRRLCLVASSQVIVTAGVGERTTSPQA